MARYILAADTAKAPIILIFDWIGKLFRKGKQTAAAKDDGSGGPNVGLCLMAANGAHPERRWIGRIVLRKLSSFRRRSW